MNLELDVRITHRCDTEANWTAEDPVILMGETVYTIDPVTNLPIAEKHGNGVLKWSELPSRSFSGGGGGGGGATSFSELSGRLLETQLPDGVALKIDTAASKADAAAQAVAQSDVGAVTTAVNEAKTKSNDALAAATTALQRANDAQNTANSVSGTANQAYSNATTALNAANNVSGTATQALNTANAAQSAASAAVSAASNSLPKTGGTATGDLGAPSFKSGGTGANNTGFKLSNGSDIGLLFMTGYCSYCNYCSYCQYNACNACDCNCQCRD